MASSTQTRLGKAPEEGVKAPVVVETEADIVLEGLQTIRTTTLQVADRVLVKDQTNQAENGVYIAGPGEWERSTDMNLDDDVSDGVMIVSNETLIVYYILLTGSTWTPDVSFINFPRLLTAGESQWGQIQGTLSDQTDLQTVLNTKIEGVAWGDITGTLGNQTDLQAALDAKLSLTGGTITGALTVEGNFTSPGIDDNATVENLQLSDGRLQLGDGSAAELFQVYLQTTNDGLLRFAGGNDGNQGANMGLYGPSHATLPGDMQLRSGSNIFLNWDESSGQMEVRTGTGAKTVAATFDVTQNLAVTNDVTINGGTSVGSHIGDGTLHYTQAAISITLSQVSDSGTAAALDTGTASGNIPILGAGGLLPSSVIPPLGITETYVVASEVAQLALTVQEGDVAVRTDLNKSFIALNDVNATMADWQELLTPTDAVLSVNGQTNVVVLNEADIADWGGPYVTTASGPYLLDTTDTLTGTLTATVGVDAGLMRANELRTLGGNFLVINAGEAHSFATGQIAENIYLNAEAGLEINSSPDNWVSLWAGRNTAVINNSSGNSSLPGNLSLTGNLELANTSEIQMRSGDVDLKTGSSSYLDIHTTGASGGIRLLDTGTTLRGYLYGSSTLIGLLSKTGQNAVMVNHGASVELYYNGVQKFNTSSAGGTLTGDWTIGNDLLLAVSGRLYLDSGSDTYIVNTVTNVIDLVAGANISFSAKQNEAYFPLGITEHSQIISASDINCHLGTYFYKTITGATTLTFSNPAATSQVTAFTLELTNASTNITWPTSVDWEGGAAPSLSTTGVDILTFITRNGGTTWHGFLCSKGSA